MSANGAFFGVTADGPAVFRAAGFSPVNAARPARAGEVLVVRARNLGPTRPDLLPPGLATIQLTAAWIPGPEFKIPEQ